MFNLLSSRNNNKQQQDNEKNFEKLTFIENGKENLTVSKIIKSGNVMVLYYANWCGHCVSTKPIWGEFLQRMNNKYNTNKPFSIVKLEDEEIKQEPTLQNEIEGFPTIKYYKGSNLSKPVQFTEERSIDSLINFINTNSNHIVNEVNKKKNLPSKTKPSKTKPRKTKTKKPKKIGGVRKTKKNKKLIKSKNLKSNSKNKSYNQSADYFTKKELQKIRKEIKGSEKIKKELLQSMNNEFKI
jgi:thiol-disulfide isomerase/thioredoxin